nr:hypothetical protein [Tanacetum cinerariifolium]
MSQIANSDADCTGCQDTRRSTSGSTQSLANKKCTINAEVFRTILDIYPRLEGVNFTNVLDNDTALTFLIDLGYKGPVDRHTNIENVDYPELIWEDFAYQIDHRKEKRSRQSEPKPEPAKKKTSSKRRVKKKVTLLADDEGVDHVSDTQDADDEDDKTESNKDEIYKYKICVHKDKDVEMKDAEVDDSDKGEEKVTNAAKEEAEKTFEAKDDAKKTELPPSSSSLSISLGFSDQFLILSSDSSLVSTVK